MNATYAGALSYILYCSGAGFIQEHIPQQWHGPKTGTPLCERQEPIYPAHSTASARVFCWEIFDYSMLQYR